MAACNNPSVPWNLALAVRLLGTIVLTTLIASAVFFALASATAGIDKTSLTERLRAAQAQGYLSRTIRPFLLRLDHAVAIWGHNECMILYMLVAPDYQSRWQEAISPLVPIPGPAAPISDACAGLKAILGGDAIADEFYHRYLHGYRVMTAFMLSMMSVHALPWSLFFGVHALLAALMIVAAARMLRSTRTDSAETHVYACFLAVGLILLIFWGLPRYAFSISFAFGDSVVIAMVLTFLLWNPFRMTERMFLATCCGFGALDAWLEFLTGQTPLMIALVPGCLAISCVADNDGLRLWRRMVGGLIAFGGTVVACFIVKWIAAIAAFGPEVASDVWAQLRQHSFGVPGPTPNDATVELLQTLGLPTTYKPTVAHWFLWPMISLGLASPQLGYGSFYLGTSIIVLSAIAAVTGLSAWYWRAETPLERSRIGALTISIGLLMAWYVVFHSHFIIHASYMARPLVWLPCVAAVAWLQIRRLSSKTPLGVGTR
jgi:hypothetical protein